MAAEYESYRIRPTTTSSISFPWPASQALRCVVFLRQNTAELCSNMATSALRTSYLMRYLSFISDQLCHPSPATHYDRVSVQEMHLYHDVEREQDLSQRCKRCETSMRLMDMNSLRRLKFLKSGYMMGSTSMIVKQ